MRLLSLLAAAVCCALAVSAAPASEPVPLEGNITQGLAAHCVAQVKACVADPTCKGGITCMQNCPKPPNGCMKKCIQSALDEAMLEVGLCAQANGCLSGSTGIETLRAQIEKP